MSWLAVDLLDDARTATQSLLLPLDTGRWLRLAVVSFFVGGVGGGGGASAAQNGVTVPSPAPVDPTAPGFGPDGPPPMPPGGATLPQLPALPVDPLVLLAVLGLFALVVGVLYAFVAATMEFVLVEGVRTREVRLRRPLRQFLGPGLRLFGFRIALLVVGLLLVGLPVAAVLGGLSFSPAALLVAPLVVVFAVVVGVGVYLVDRLTADFVVPTMIAEGRSVSSGWRRLLPLLRREAAELALYLAVRLALGVAASIAVGLVVGLVALVVAIPFVAVGGLVAFVAGVSGVGLAVLAVLAVGFVLALVAVGAVVQVPVVVYFRYYALYVLGAFDDRLDLVGVQGAGPASTTT